MLAVRKKAELLMNILEDSRLISEREINYEISHVNFLEKTLNNLKSAVDKLRIARNMSVVGGGLISAKSRFNDDFSPPQRKDAYTRIREKMRFKKHNKFLSPSYYKKKLKATLYQRPATRIPYDYRTATDLKSAFNFDSREPRMFRDSHENNRQFSDLKSIKSLDLFKGGDLLDNRSVSKLGENQSIKTFNMRRRLTKPHRSTKQRMNHSRLVFSPGGRSKVGSIEMDSMHIPTMPSSQMRYKRYSEMNRNNFRRRVDTEVPKEALDTFKKRKEDYKSEGIGEVSRDSEVQKEGGIEGLDVQPHDLTNDEDENIFGVDKTPEVVRKKRSIDDESEFDLKNESIKEPPNFALPEEAMVQFDDNIEPSERVRIRKLSPKTSNVEIEERFQQRQIQLDAISAELEKFDAEEDDIEDDFANI